MRRQSFQPRQYVHSSILTMAEEPSRTASLGRSLLAKHFESLAIFGSWTTHRGSIDFDMACSRETVSSCIRMERSPVK